MRPYFKYSADASFSKRPRRARALARHPIERSTPRAGAAVWMEKNGTVPFTFFAHQAPVLPLKLARPAWFSGTALVVGSMAPDAEYFIRGEPVSALSHTLLGQIVFCLPVALVMVAIVERVLAPTLPLHLPDLGAFHLRDYARLSVGRRGLTPWVTVLASALIGSLSHIAWDGFTHEHGWAVQRLPALDTRPVEVAGYPVPAYKLLQHGSTLVGGLATIAMLFVIGRRRLLLSWRGAPQGSVPSPTRASHMLIWVLMLLGGAIGAAASLAVNDDSGGPLRTVVCVFLRATSVAFLGICAGCVLASRRLSRPVGSRSSRLDSDE